MKQVLKLVNFATKILLDIHVFLLVFLIYKQGLKYIKIIDQVKLVQSTKARP